MQNIIKFGLPLNNTKVYYLEQLRQNFVMHEVTELFHQGLLQHWLRFRGYTEELEQLNALVDLDEEALKQALIHIFQLDPSRFVVPTELPLAGYSKVELSYLLINRLSSRYSTLLTQVLSHPFALSQLESEVATLVNEYGAFLELDPLTFKLVKAKPLIFLLILTHKRGWSIFHLDGTESENLQTMLPKLHIESESLLGAKLVEHIGLHFDEHFGAYFNFKELEPCQSLSEYVSAVDYDSDATEGVGWTNLFAKGSKNLVLIKDGAVELRSAGDVDFSNTLSCSKLFLVDGLDYRCLEKPASIFYMTIDQD